LKTERCDGAGTDRIHRDLGGRVRIFAKIDGIDPSDNLGDLRHGSIGRPMKEVDAVRARRLAESFSTPVT
jgi:hypothetical protein